MEVSSSKLEMKGLVASTRIERDDSAPCRWNAGTSLTSPLQARTNSSSRRRCDSMALNSGGSSLLSLKAYYRKLRTFKGTVKALINLRRLPAAPSTSEATVESTHPELARRPTVTVARISLDATALHTVQAQVKSLVENGHVVTELDAEMRGTVTYRNQGDLNHYTEGNLRKRAALEMHPHMIALTQRLWLSAVQDGEEDLTFPEYEAFMLRLHRLILPEFDLAGSKELIHDDWMRDTSGADHLDYRFFHLSMFELICGPIPLNQKTYVTTLAREEAQIDLFSNLIRYGFVYLRQYISLLYCIMHSLTFVWNDKHILKPLEDIISLDILNECKAISMEVITQDLETEVNSDVAQMYHDRLLQDDYHEEDPQYVHEQVQPLDEPGQQRKVPLESSGTAKTPDFTTTAESMDGSGGTISSGDQQLDQNGVVDAGQCANRPTTAQRDPKRPRTSGARSASRVRSASSSDSLQKNRRLSSTSIRPMQPSASVPDPANVQSNAIIVDSLADRESHGTMESNHLNVQGKGKGGGRIESLASLVKGIAVNPFTSNKANGVVLGIGTIADSDFVDSMVANTSFTSKPSGLTRSSTASRGINWRDFYDDSRDNTRKGSDQQEILRGSKVDASRFRGAVQPPRSTSPESVGLSLESVRLNQENSPRAEPLRLSLKANEQRDAGYTVKEAVLSMQPLLIGSMAGVSPRSRSASYKRPLSSPKKNSTQGNGGGNQYYYTDMELSGTGVGMQNSMRPSVKSGSIPGQHQEPQQSHNTGKPLSPRQSRVLQQECGSAATPQLLDGILGLAITAPTLASQSQSPLARLARSPRHQSTGVSPLVLIDEASFARDSNAMAPTNLGLSHFSSNQRSGAIASLQATTLPARRQQSSARKLNQHQHSGSEVRKSMLAANTRRWNPQQQQQHSGAKLAQFFVHSAPMSPRK